MNKVLMSITIMFICFFISGMFFVSSGIVDADSGEVIEDKCSEILTQLNELPFVHVDAECIVEEKDYIIELNADK